ncbi:MAG: hypothetical protein D6800_03810 [Candidatus Zixiibacteriota bacterium]|nr:MAG: hypothetical protein D6800_03810 [candidate division Zixibacteria bacterium]
MANSLPKSGTHLLLQIARAIPDTTYIGGFISHASSITLWERPFENIKSRLDHLHEGEVVGAHIRYDERTADFIRNMNLIHLFIFRDPRDVILSEEAYLMQMAPWNRMHRILKKLPTREERLKSLIRGVPGIREDIGERVRTFIAWLDEADVIGIRYEDLQGPGRKSAIRRLSEEIVARVPSYGPPDELTERMENAIDPRRSHTFREGGTEKWRRELSAELLDQIQELAGDEIARLGYPPA